MPTGDHDDGDRRISRQFLSDLGRCLAAAIWAPAAFYAASLPIAVAVLLASLSAHLVTQRCHLELQAAYEADRRAEAAEEFEREEQKRRSPQSRNPSRQPSPRLSGGHSSSTPAPSLNGSGREAADLPPKSASPRLAAGAAPPAPAVEPLPSAEGPPLPEYQRDMNKVVCHFFSHHSKHQLRRTGYLALKAVCRYCSVVSTMALLVRMVVKLGPEWRDVLRGTGSPLLGLWLETAYVVADIPTAVLVLALTTMYYTRLHRSRAGCKAWVVKLRVSLLVAVGALALVFAWVALRHGPAPALAQRKVPDPSASQQAVACFRVFLTTFPGMIGSCPDTMPAHGLRRGAQLLRYMTALTGVVMVAMSGLVRYVVGGRNASPVALALIGSSEWGYPTEAALLVIFASFIPLVSAVTLLIDAESDGNTADILTDIVAQPDTAPERRAQQRNYIAVGLGALAALCSLNPSHVSEFSLAMSAACAVLNVTAIKIAARIRVHREAQAGPAFVLLRHDRVPVALRRVVVQAGRSNLSWTEIAAAAFFIVAAVHIQLAHRFG
jgi:hypothetical protein